MKYTDNFIKYYLCVRDLFSEKTHVDKRGNEFKNIRDYNDITEAITWDDTLDLYILGLYTRDFFGAKHEKDIGIVEESLDE